VISTSMRRIGREKQQILSHGTFFSQLPVFLVDWEQPADCNCNGLHGAVVNFSFFGKHSAPRHSERSEESAFPLH
ncbi:MAG TPA: hypothetical protein VGX94_16040, partial [Terriglobia bacterium]|nr:hypothetical protein [Terriglobia bacterium]